MSKPATPWVDLPTLNAVIDQSKATGAGFKLLLVMCRHLDADGICRSSVPDLAAECRVQVRALQYIRQKLVEQGELLTIEKGGGNETSGFRIAVGPVTAVSPVQKSAPVHKVAPVQESAPTGAEICTPPVQKIAPVPVQKSAPPSNKKLLKKEERKETEKRERENALAVATAATDAESGSSEKARLGKATGLPVARALWPAALPTAAEAVLEKHAIWFTEVCRECWGGYASDRDSEEEELITAAFNHAGGAVIFRGMRENSRDGTFVRRDFLKYLKFNDAAYAEAIERSAQESLGPAKVKAAARAAGRGS